MCFLFGGMKYREQTFNTTVASTMSSLMAVATASLIIPAALYSTVDVSKEEGFSLVLNLSRGTSVVLLILYVLYLVFQLHTHSDFFDAELQSEDQENTSQQDSNEQDTPILTVIESGVVLVAVTLAVAVCAEYLVGSIDSVVGSSGISKTFIGLILIPIVGNAAEHVTAVVVAMKNKVCICLLHNLHTPVTVHSSPSLFKKERGWVLWHSFLFFLCAHAAHATHPCKMYPTHSAPTTSSHFCLVL
jgi:Ca2+:H+ antiporter